MAGLGAISRGAGGNIRMVGVNRVFRLLGVVGFAVLAHLDACLEVKVNIGGGHSSSVFPTLLQNRHNANTFYHDILFSMA